MTYFSFTQKIMRGESIEVFGEGRMARDFTYIDGIVDALDHPPARQRVMKGRKPISTIFSKSETATPWG